MSSFLLLALSTGSALTQPDGRSLSLATRPRLVQGGQRAARHALSARSSASVVLCAAAQPPPSPVRALLSSNAWRVASATLLIMLDITFYTFPLPFLGDFLSAQGHTPQQISNLVATFTYTALVAGAAVVAVESTSKTQRTQRQQFVALATVAFVMSAVATAQAVFPRYSVLFFTRLVQGAASQFAWASALAAAASLGPLLGVKATAWVMAGNSLGEVIGPQFGSSLFTRGGVQLPFAAAAVLAGLLSAALLGAAAALKPSAPQARAERVVGKSPLKDSATLRLCFLLALTCGGVRSALDNLLPLFLRGVHGFSVGQISNAMLAAALCFVLGACAPPPALRASRPSPLIPRPSHSSLLTANIPASIPPNDTANVPANVSANVPANAPSSLP